MMMAALGLLAACQSNTSQSANAAQDTTAAAGGTDTTAAPAETDKQVRAVYAGTLPCADCAGIQTELTLYVDMTYKVKEIYQGKGKGNTFEAQGNFNEEKGYEDDPEAALVVLNYDKPGQERYFVRFTDKQDELQMLDKDRKQIKSTLNYTLTKR